MDRQECGQLRVEASAKEKLLYNSHLLVVDHMGMNSTTWLDFSIS